MRGTKAGLQGGRSRFLNWRDEPVSKPLTAEARRRGKVAAVRWPDAGRFPIHGAMRHRKSIAGPN